MPTKKAKSAKKLSVKKIAIKDLDASKGKNVKGGAAALRRRPE